MTRYISKKKKRLDIFQKKYYYVCTGIKHKDKKVKSLRRQISPKYKQRKVELQLKT